MFVPKEWEEKKANRPLSIRMTEEEFQKLKAAADAKGMSFNGFVLACCRFSLHEISPIERVEEGESDVRP